MDGVVLAELLAERLQEVVPPDFAVLAERDLISTRRWDGSGGGGSTGVADIVDQPVDPVMNLPAACHAARDLVQDIVVEETATVWPGAVPSSPRVAVGGRHVRLSYGSELAGTVLELRPIVLA